MKRIVSILLVFGMLISTSSCGTASNQIDRTIDKAQGDLNNAISTFDEYVNIVKNTSPEAYSDITYGEAFDEFFSNPNWRHFTGVRTEETEETDDSEKPLEIEEVSEEDTEDTLQQIADVVEFKGGCSYEGVDVTVKIQFVFNDDHTSFEIEHFSMNEVPQMRLMLWAMLEKVFQQAAEKRGITSNQNEDDDITSEELDGLESTTEVEIEPTPSKETQTELLIPPAPQNVKVTSQLSENESYEITVTWDAFPEASSYEIYLEEDYDSGTYRHTEDVFDTYYATKCSIPVNLRFKVHAIYNDHYGESYSDWSETVSTSFDILDCPIRNTAEITVCFMGGQISTHGDMIQGFTTDYVVYNGAQTMVRESLEDACQVTAVNSCYSYGVLWYELFATTNGVTDYGKYLGWVNADYIDFN